jgi:hypothetical protein
LVAKTGDCKLATDNRAREQAVLTEREVLVAVGETEFRVQPHGFGKYRYCLSHQNGLVGVTTSTKLPALRIQPRATFIHGVGARKALEWFRDCLEAECGAIRLTASRIDLHADWQGWSLEGEDRRRFVCRSEDRITHEFGDLLSGFQFGKRTTNTIFCRIYDKSREMERTGAAYWQDIWGDQFDPQTRVLRVEFEFGRQGLAEFGISSPFDAIDAAGALWSYATEQWLSLRTPSQDSTISRWPVSSEWEQIRQARIGDSAFGLDRVYGGKRRGELEKMAPAVAGYLSNVAALTNSSSFVGAVPHLQRLLEWYGIQSGRTFEDRTAQKRRDYDLP